MQRHHTRAALRRLRSSLLAACFAAGLLAISASGAHERTWLRAPGVAAPANGAAVQLLPAFAWGAVGGADAYEFQIAPDQRFRGGSTTIVTSNTRATLPQTLSDGTYWWRVRALAKSGAASEWSSARSIRKDWRPIPKLTWPVGATVQFPTTPLTLRWKPVDGAVRYVVWVATDPELASVVTENPIETAATNLTVNVAPPAGPDGKQYWWAVAAVDAQRNRGPQSPAARFVWRWPSATKLGAVRDLRPEPETFDPQFSWQAVAGAAAYEVEINASRDWAVGSKVCCSKAVLGTVFSPTTTLRDNTYYWRVRALNADGNAGVWNPSGEGAASFEKVFDRGAPQTPSIKGLRMVGSAQTDTPVVVWDAVPGASSYFVEVVPLDGSNCNWTAFAAEHWRVTTAVAAWTPLGVTNVSPYPVSGMAPSIEGAQLVPGKSYCVRVRARADRDDRNGDVSGDFTYLNGADRSAFTFTGWPGRGARGYLSAGDYLRPRDASVTSTPYFAWTPRTGMSWFVLVAKDPDFHTIVDYGFTRIPAYAPRRQTNPITYSDESTKYYWAVLPAPSLDGRNAVGDPLSASAAAFNKQSVPPTLQGPDRDPSGLLEVFRWTPVDGARKYHIQVALDGDFGRLVDDVRTAAVSYTPAKMYPVDVRLFWRVRAETETAVGLSWSRVGTFRRTLRAPRLLPLDADGDLIPAVRWTPVLGAVSYDLHAEQPNRGPRDFRRLRSSAASFTTMTGIGHFRWRVRPNFGSGFATVSGPYSSWQVFTRTIEQPDDPRTEVGARSVLLTWRPKRAARAYRIEVARGPDFRRQVESGRTDGTAYAPLLRGSYGDGGTFYWRVAALDESSNLGAFTKPLRFRIRLR
jgi:hypothetical protein